MFGDIVSVDKHRTVIIQHSRATANQRPADSRPTHRRSILAPTLDQSRDVPKSSQSHCPRNTAWNERSCSIFWYPELKNTQKWDERFQGFEGYNQHKKCTWTCSSLQQFCFHCLPVFSTRLGLFRGNTMENRTLKAGSSPPNEHKLLIISDLYTDYTECPPQEIRSHDFGQSLKGFVA